MEAKHPDPFPTTDSNPPSTALGSVPKGQAALETHSGDQALLTVLWGFPPQRGAVL